MASMKKQEECLRKAQNIVEILIDGTNDEDYFLNQLRFINDTHYIDITEERAIMKICGYPICQQRLINVPKKKYHISSIHNKVYDITERKLFCSNQCFKASGFLKKQLLSSPLWIRDREKVPHFSLLKCSTELPGNEISFNVERAVVPEDDLATFDKSQRRISQNNISGKNENKSNNENNNEKVLKFCDKQCEIKKSYDSVEQQLDNELSSCDAEVHKSPCNIELESHLPERVHLRTSSIPETPNKSCYPQPVQRELSKDKEPPAVRSIIKVEKTPAVGTSFSPQKPIQYLKKVLTDTDQSFTKNSADFILHVKKSLREWITMDSLVCIVGFEAVKRQMLEKGKIFDANDFCRSDSDVYERYTAICKRLKILELEDDKYQKDVQTYEVPSKPLPDYNVLKEQTQEMVIKVRSFYMGDKKVTFDESGSANEHDENDEPNTLPRLHQYSKNVIRRNCVLDKLKIVLPDLAAMLGLTYIELAAKIKKLAMTFKFSAHNVTFKPLEWNLIGLVLLKLLSVEDVIVHDRLLQRKNYVNAMLLSYQLENNYLDLLCTWLTDIEQVLKNEES